MMRLVLVQIFGLILLSAAPLAAQTLVQEEEERLAVALAEADLEKRSKLVLQYARGAVGRMLKAFQAGDSESGQGILNNIVKAAEISEESLDETGKIARKSPKHFKRAEIAIRKLINDLQDAKRRLTFDEGQYVDPAIERLEQIHSGLLAEIMKPKKR